jgi:hypothetical protein
MVENPDQLDVAQVSFSDPVPTEPVQAYPLQPIPEGYITRAQYRTLYGEAEYALVPESAWGNGGYPDAMKPKTWREMRGKKGV